MPHPLTDARLSSHRSRHRAAVHGSRLSPLSAATVWRTSLCASVCVSVSASFHSSACRRYAAHAEPAPHSPPTPITSTHAITSSAPFSHSATTISHIRPEGIAEQDPLSDRYNLHADLLLLRHDLKLYIDVTVTRPTCLSQCSRPYVRNIPLSSTRTPAANKRSKYTDISKANGYTLIPFVVESYGGLGPDATSLLKRLSHYSREYTPRAFLLHARKRLSVTLQSSNANIALMGMQETHLRMHARKPSGHVSYAQKRAANMGYPQPRDSDQLRARMGPAVFSSGAAAAASVAEEHGDEESDEARDGEFQHASRVNTAGLTIRLDVDSLQADTSTSCLHPCIQHERSVVQSASVSYTHLRAHEDSTIRCIRTHATLRSL